MSTLSKKPYRGISQSRHLEEKHRIALLKVKDLKANTLRLKLQREKKRKYRKRMNKSKENQNPNSAESSFSNKSVKCRGLKKILNALPKISNKRNDIAWSLYQKYTNRFKLQKARTSINDLHENEVEWLSWCQFMDRPNITYTNLGENINDTLLKRTAKASLFLFANCYGQSDLLEINYFWWMFQHCAKWSRRLSNNFQ